MKNQYLHIPPWVSKGLSPSVNWAVSGPYPQSASKRIALHVAGVLILVLVRLQVVRLGGMGVIPPCKRSEADPALNSSQSFTDGRGRLVARDKISTSRHDKQKGASNDRSV